MKALQGHVSQLRKALGAERVITKPPGYALRVEEGELDLDRFEQLVREGREHLAAGDPKAASRELESALALWRGPAPGLDDRRLAAVEDRIDSDLALRRHRHVVAELETLVAAHPLRERLRGQLMLALYRSGRQADALEQYRQTRETLVDQLGIEPSEELQELQRAILRHEPELEARRPRSGSLRRPDAAALAVALDARGRRSNRAARRGRGRARLLPRPWLVSGRRDSPAHIRFPGREPPRAVPRGAARRVCCHPRRRTLPARPARGDRPAQPRAAESAEPAAAGRCTRRSEPRGCRTLARTSSRRLSSARSPRTGTTGTGLRSGRPAALPSGTPTCMLRGLRTSPLRTPRISSSRRSTPWRAGSIGAPGKPTEF